MGYMGPGDHEGWVAPLFADGAVGCGWHKGGIMVTALGDGTELDYDDWQARPPVEVVGHVAACSCGWRGPVQRGLAHEDGYLEDGDEGRVIEAWRRHIEPAKMTELVSEAAARYSAAGRDLDDAVREARRLGATWADVGRAVGITRQSARERWDGRL